MWNPRMSLQAWQALWRQLVPPRAELPAAARVDYLVLYRSERKRRYFAELIAHALPGDRCVLASYHQLPARRGQAIDTITLARLEHYALRELFSARDSHWLRHLRWPLRRLRRMQIRKMYRRLSGLLMTLEPGAIILWNGAKFQDAVLHAVNNGRFPVIYYENGVLPNTTTIDACGINAASSVPRDPAFYQACANVTFTPVAAVDRKPRAGGRRESAGSAWHVDLGAYRILVPFQKERDTQLLAHSHWITSMPQLVQELCAAANEVVGLKVQLVFREHPSSATRYPKLTQLALAHGHCFANGGRLADLLTLVDAVITVNSSVGLDALAANKKVMVLGDALYNLPGIVLRAENRVELVGAMAALPTFKGDDSLRQRFLAYLACVYAVVGDWRKPDPAHWAAVATRLNEFRKPKAACALGRVKAGIRASSQEKSLALPGVNV